MLQTVDNIEELKKFVHSLFTPIVSKWDGTPIVVLLSGDLGAGKTTITQFLAEMFHVKHLIKSPTFIYVDEHAVEANKIAGMLYHWDLWRLKQDDFALLKMDEKIIDNTVHAIEWWKRCESDITRLLESKSAVIVKIHLKSASMDGESRVVEWEIAN